MKAGNIPEKDFIEFYYIEGEKPPFNDYSSEKRIIFRPHQGISIFDFKNKYKPVNINCDIKEFQCVCNKIDLNIMDKIIGDLEIQDTLLWIDPTNIPTQCLASLIYSWKLSHSLSKNISLGIIVNKEKSQIENNNYELWTPRLSGPIFTNKLSNFVWYPSLERTEDELLKITEKYRPYDVYPLVDFSKTIVQMGEHYITNHAILLEKTRTRTRHFVFIDNNHPKRAFDELYETLISLPRRGPIILNPVLTPGGSILKYLILLLAGSLSESFFITPKNETPIQSNKFIQGFIILRKVR